MLAATALRSATSLRAASTTTATATTATATATAAAAAAAAACTAHAPAATPPTSTTLRTLFVAPRRALSGVHPERFVYHTVSKHEDVRDDINFLERDRQQYQWAPADTRHTGTIPEDADIFTANMGPGFDYSANGWNAAWHVLGAVVASAAVAAFAAWRKTLKEPVAPIDNPDLSAELGVKQ